jgi:Cu/Ag efflux pump CusA
MVRGIGLIGGLKDIEDISLGAFNGTPVTVGNVGSVQLGPEFRRGVLDKDGKEAVGGVVVIRYGANAREVIAAVKKKIGEIQPGLPAGVKIVPFYDRSTLIDHAVDTLRHALIEELILVTLAHVLFLWHFRSILVVTIPLPLAVLGAFLFMKGAGISSNIMSLGGIAIAIGVLVDAGIVMTENVIRQAEQYEGGARRLSRSHLGDHAQGRAACGQANLLCHGHHHSCLRSGFRAHRHGGQDVSSAGLHQDLCHGMFHHIGHHAGSCPVHLSHPRQAAS